MKLTLGMFAIFAASAAYGQTACSSNEPLFTFDNSGSTSAKEIRALGSSPEFPFLRNLSTPQQVASAMKKHAEMDKLNGILENIGFSNGAADISSSNISMAYLPAGTEGNMGSGGYSYSYARLEPEDGGGFKAWKVSGPTGSCYVYFMAKCGNAFYPKSAQKTACISTPVTLNSQPQEITVANTPMNYDTSKTFVYYHRRKHRRPYLNGDISDGNPSKPILLESATTVTAVPQTYRVTVSTPNENVTICPDSTTNVAANISVEKVSDYTGYYPNKTKVDYKRVSKRVYRKTARKMRKVNRKEERVARLTGVTVNRA